MNKMKILIGFGVFSLVVACVNAPPQRENNQKSSRLDPTAVLNHLDTVFKNHRSINGADSLRSIQSSVFSSNQDSLKARWLYAKGRFAHAQKKYGEAILLFKKAKGYFEQSGNLHPNYGWSTYYIFAAYYFQGDYDYIQRALPPLLLASHGQLLASNPEALANCYNILGVVNRREGNLEAMTSSYRQVLELNEKYQLGLDFIYHNLSQAYSDQAKYDSAMYVNLKLMQLSRAKNDSSALFLVHCNIAGLKISQRKLKEADEELEAASALTTVYVGNNARRFQLYQLKGRYHLYNQEADKALNWALQAEPLAPDAFLKAGMNELAGNALFDLKNHRESIKSFEVAANLYEQMDANIKLAVVYRYLGQNHFQLNAISKAQSYFDKSIVILDSLDSPKELATVYLTYHELLARNGLFQASLAMYKKYRLLEDSLFTQERQKNLDELNIKYQTQELNLKNILQQNMVLEIQRDKLIIILTTVLIFILLALAFLYFLRLWRITQQKAMLEQLQLNNAISDLKTVQYSLMHDLKKPINHLQLLVKKNLNSIQAQPLLKSISQIDGYLSALARLVQIENQHVLQHTFPLKELVEDILDNAPDDWKKEFVIEIEIEKLALTTDRYLLRVVLENIIYNALKYAHKQSNPRLCINAKKVGSQILIQIEDNGPGWPSTQHDRLFEPFQLLDAGISHSFHRSLQGNGLGLYISKRILHKLNGSISAVSTPHGATFSLSL